MTDPKPRYIISGELRDKILETYESYAPMLESRWANEEVLQLKSAPQAVSLEGVERYSLSEGYMFHVDAKRDSSYGKAMRWEETHLERWIKFSDLRNLAMPVTVGREELWALLTKPEYGGFARWRREALMQDLLALLAGKVYHFTPIQRVTESR